MCRVTLGNLRYYADIGTCTIPRELGHLFLWLADLFLWWLFYRTDLFAEKVSAETGLHPKFFGASALLRRVFISYHDRF